MSSARARVARADAASGESARRVAELDAQLRDVSATCDQLRTALAAAASQVVLLQCMYVSVRSCAIAQCEQRDATVKKQAERIADMLKAATAHEKTLDALRDELRATARRADEAGELAMARDDAIGKLRDANAALKAANARVAEVTGTVCVYVCA
jgi:chromosome segregation ATPase